MNWHVVTVPRAELSRLMLRIGHGGGVVTHSCCEGDQVAVTYVTTDH